MDFNLSQVGYGAINYLEGMEASRIESSKPGQVTRIAGAGLWPRCYARSCRR